MVYSPYIDRRRENGWGLYWLLGITKGDKDKMHIQHRKNFEAFGAPVCFFFTIDKELGRGSMLDYGMFLQNLMVAARGGRAWIPARKISKYLSHPEGGGRKNLRHGSTKLMDMLN
ncbi:hypothetical protein [Polynucleobacter necessarius]|uniref:hypothetical protein n=1 Tax=Polynucleobacter necessarius TaxID=576610 RepID=UPI001E63561F|nr:hypothetical protein [Polynucleobacter necessarius]